MLLRKFKRNLMSLHFSLFALIVFVIVYTVEVSECRTSVLGNSIRHKTNESKHWLRSVWDSFSVAGAEVQDHLPRLVASDVRVPVEIEPIIQKQEAVPVPRRRRHKRSPSRETRKPKSRKRSKDQPEEEAEMEARSSTGAIAVALLNNYLSSNKQGDKDKDKNPLDMYNMQIAEFIQDRVKKLRKRLKSALRKLRECITLFPFSIDRSCLR